MTTREEWNAYRALGMHSRVTERPELRQALEALRTRAELERAKRASRRRKRLLLALELLAGAFCTAFVLYCAWRLSLMLAP